MSMKQQIVTPSAAPGLCTEGLSFSNCRIDWKGGAESKFKPKPARCGAIAKNHRQAECDARAAKAPTRPLRLTAASGLLIAIIILKFMHPTRPSSHHEHCVPDPFSVWFSSA